MSWAQPSFFKSEYFYYNDKGEPALKEGAPQELIDELQEFIEYHKQKDVH